MPFVLGSPTSDMGEEACDRTTHCGQNQSYDRSTDESEGQERSDTDLFRSFDVERRNFARQQQGADLNLEQNEPGGEQRVGDVRGEVGHGSIEPKREAQRQTKRQMQSEHGDAPDECADSHGCGGTAWCEGAAPQSRPALLAQRRGSLPEGRLRHDSGEEGGGIVGGGMFSAIRRYIDALLFAGSYSSTAFHSSFAASTSLSASSVTPSINLARG